MYVHTVESQSLTSLISSFDNLSAAEKRVSAAGASHIRYRWKLYAPYKRIEHQPKSVLVASKPKLYPLTLRARTRDTPADRTHILQLLVTQSLLEIPRVDKRYIPLPLITIGTKAHLPLLPSQQRLPALIFIFGSAAARLIITLV